ncbi:MAG TPA: energy transducer TonB [Bryobacteraceae bacterium]|nr:energy transducer TonB [Bryobacteraceae bacterium]
MPEVLNAPPAAPPPGPGPQQGLYQHADDHLDRLFAAEKAEIPWFISLYRNIHDVIKPEKLPPLVLTSKPVAVKDIWGLYRPDPKSFMSSTGLVVSVFAILMLIGATNKAVQKKIAESVTLVAPISAYKPDVKPAGGGGGGGDHSIKPVSKGQLPKPALKQFVPPQIVDHKPLLEVAPSIIAPPDAALPQNNLPNWGDPLAKLGDLSNGTGFGGGMGSGSGGGVGSGKGGGFGPGEGGGFGGGVFRVGGGVSAPAVLFKIDPEYSEEARKAKYSGTVTLAVVVTPDGKATDIHVIKSLGMGLDEKAIEAVQKWKFKPGMKGGQPVPVRATIEVNFRLL